MRHGRHHAAHQDLRDCHHARGAVGLHYGERAAAVAVRAGHGAAFHPVRAGEVRLSAAPPAHGRAHRRQRHDGNGRLCRHSVGQHDWRGVDDLSARAGVCRGGLSCRRIGRLDDGALCAAHPAAVQRHPHQLESVQRNGAQPQARSGRPTGARGADRHCLDVVLRRGLPHPVSDLHPRGGARQRSGGVTAAGDFRRGHRPGLGGLRVDGAWPGGNRPGAGRRHRHVGVRHRPLLCHAKSATQRAVANPYPVPARRRALAADGRSAAGFGQRRDLQRAALRLHSAPRGRNPPRSRNRCQQYAQRPVHDCLRGVLRRVAHRRRGRADAAAHRGRVQRPGGGLVGANAAGVRAALRRLGAAPENGGGFLSAR